MENNLFGFVLNEIKENQYKITGNNCPDDMVIIVKKELGGYRAECNYSVKRKRADNAYQAMHLCSTAEETLKHLLMSLKPERNSAWVKI